MRTTRKAASSAPPRARGAALAGVSAAGAGCAYLFGPGDARSRRARLASVFRRGEQPAGELNDPALADRIETEVFSPEGIPKGDILVDVESGVVFLRGEVPDAARRDSVERACRSVDGVTEVQNMLRLPDAPPPA